MVRACTTREERDKATLELLGEIEAQAASTHAWLLGAVHYDEGDRVGVSADDRREAERRMAEVRHLAAKLAATYGDPPLVVVPADAVTDTGEHEPEDDGQPTDEEIDEAAAYASLVDMSQPTPGPWVYTDDGRLGNVETVDGVPVAMAQMRSGLGLPDPERAANARLIAAAPDLFEACLKVSAFFDRVGAYEHPDYEPVRNAIIAAVVKAKGGEA